MEGGIDFMDADDIKDLRRGKWGRDIKGPRELRPQTRAKRTSWVSYCRRMANEARHKRRGSRNAAKAALRKFDVDKATPHFRLERVW